MLSLSFHQQANGAKPSHNRRSEYALKHLKNIDPSLSKNNIIYRDLSIEDAYKKYFSEAVKEYNLKQNRQSRRIHDYLNEIRLSKQKYEMYEIIVQIGNCHDVGIRSMYNDEELDYLIAKEDGVAEEYYSDEEIMSLEHAIEKVENCKRATAALKEFMRTWDDRNKYMKLYGAYLHADEIGGTVHLHLDVIPVAEHMSKGMKVQNSLSKACEEEVEYRMGRRFIELEQKRKWKHPINRWQDLNRQDLQHIALEYGLETTWNREQKAFRKHLTIAEYKEYAERLESLNKACNEKEQEKIKITSDINRLKNLNNKLQEYYRQIEKQEDITRGL